MGIAEAATDPSVATAATAPATTKVPADAAQASNATKVPMVAAQAQATPADGRNAGPPTSQPTTSRSPTYWPGWAQATPIGHDRSQGRNQAAERRQSRPAAAAGLPVANTAAGMQSTFGRGQAPGEGNAGAEPWIAREIKVTGGKEAKEESGKVRHLKAVEGQRDGRQPKGENAEPSWERE